MSSDSPDPPGPDQPVSDAELHAFVDGQLDADRLRAVVAWLHDRPEAAERVAAWHAQRAALRRLHREVDAEPVPPALTQVVMRRRRAPWRSAAAAAALLTLGAGGGLLAGWMIAGDRAGPDAGSVLAFARDAVVAHAVYTPESRHPVEVAAADEGHLVQWLSRRLGQPLKAPVLRARGFDLLGGRLLPGAAGPRAQFMYQDGAGRRVTLYVTVFDADHAPDEIAFRRLHRGGVETFYWIERRFGYALSGELPSADMQALAREVYAQLAG